MAAPQQLRNTRFVTATRTQQDRACPPDPPRWPMGHSSGRGPGIVEKSRHQGDELAPLRRSQRREQLVLDLVDDRVEVEELCDAFRRDRDDIAAPVFGVDCTFDEVTRLKLSQRGGDITAVDPRVAAEIGLTRGSPFFERSEQSVVIAAKAAPVGLEASVEQP